jgi:hypothetical protein
MKHCCIYVLVISAGVLFSACGSGDKEKKETTGYYKSMANTVNKTKAIQKEMAQRMVDATGSLSRTDNAKK